jgi:chromosome segregation ATPase
MKIILLTVLAGLLILWAGIAAMLKWIRPVKDEHILWVGGYASIVTGVLLFLVINTSMTQQKSALTETRTLLRDQVDTMGATLRENTERLMGQLEEKAELTSSEMEIRGMLSQERTTHAQTRARLAETINEVKAVSSLRDRERQAHFAHRDSLNTERSLHATTQERLTAEEQGHRDTRNALTKTQRELGQTDEKARHLAKGIGRLRESVEKAESRAEKSEDNEKGLLSQFRSQDGQLGQHTESLIRLQAMVDSLFLKQFKHTYEAPGEAPAPPK